MSQLLITRPTRIAATCSLALLAAAAPARADLFVGRVVNAQGQGIANVDIDIEAISGGGDPNVSMDFTDANGFFSVTTEPGTWQLTFIPPPPPVTTDLIKVIPSFTIVGTANIGDVQLDPGVGVTGRVVNSAGVPVAGVNLDVIDAAGVNLQLVQDNSNALGNFSLAVPSGPIELRFDSSGVLGQTLAAVALPLSLTSNGNIGDVTLPPGFSISGVVLKPNGTPVQQADLDIVDGATGATLYTPKDNTTDFGTYSVVVPQGVYDVEICPAFADRLVATTFTNVTVNGNVNLGATSLAAGVVLSGTVRDSSGTPQANADVDANFTASGAEVTLCGDNTNASGQYAVVVPTGTLTIAFEPAGFSQPLGADIHPGVLVSGNTLLDGVLPDCSFGSSYGAGLAGTGGFVPQLGLAGGAPRVGNHDLTYELDGALGSSLGILIIGLGQANLPFLGGSLLVNLGAPNALLPVFAPGAAGVGGAGSASIPFPLEIKPGLVGLALFAQCGLQDFAAVQDVALTNGYSLTLCN